MQKQENFHNSPLGVRGSPLGVTGSIKVFAPATIANLVCGFDVLGMALNFPRDEMQLTLSKLPGIRILHKDI